MPNRFVWLTTAQDVVAGYQGEPPPWPREVLDRHGLRELRPAEAVPDPRAPARVRSTVYRASTLLMPDELFHPGNRGDLVAVNEVVKDNALQDLEPPPSLDREGRNEGARRAMDAMPRPVVLRSLTGGPAPDAWTVLQSLRTRLSSRSGGPVGKIALEHAYFGAMFGPGPNGDPHGVRDDGGGSPARIGYGRRPVAYLGDPPARPEPPRGGRRPVVAVLDTGYGSSSWFGTSAGETPPQNGFLHAYQVTQQMIAAQAGHVAGLTRTEVLLQDREGPLYTDGISQVLAPSTGHGTFIAGLIRQHAPVADVLSVRVLQPDNVCYESDLLLALHMLLADVRDARHTGNPDGIVDVVSLSLGYYPEDPDEPQATRIEDVLRELAGEGVLTVACAGNDSTARPFLPASLTWGTKSKIKWTGPKVVGVGALNPNSSTAWFSNTGRNCKVLAPGANLVSVFPDDVRGSEGPGATHAGREGMDPDDYSSGFASWSGTSFAAPLVAAELARLIVECAAEDDDLRLGDLSARTAARRVRKALRRLEKSSRRR